MKKMVGNLPGAVLGMIVDLIQKLIAGAIKPYQLELFLKKQNSFQMNPLLEWQLFYKEVFGIKVNFTKLQLPSYRDGFTRLIILVAGMTAQRLFDKCKELFDVRHNFGEDLNKIVKSDRNTCKTYAVWWKDEIDRDPGVPSYDHLKDHVGITLEERLVYELFYFWKTGKHLYISAAKLCWGSHTLRPNPYNESFTVRYTPLVTWEGPKLCIGWEDFDPKCAYFGPFRSCEIVV